MRRPIRTRLSRAISAAAPAVIAAYAAGLTGKPVILGIPRVGSSVTYLDGIRTTDGNPGTTASATWWVGKDGVDAVQVGSGNTSPTFTNAHLMKQVSVQVARTNTAGTVTVESYRVRVMPASFTIGQGPDADAGETNDPATAAAWSSTTLYKEGSVVTSGGSTYVCAEPYSYGADPATSGEWVVVPTAYYIDPDHASASDANAGTSPSLPWATYAAVRKKVTSGVTGFSAAAAGSIFLFARGCSMPFAVSLGSLSNVPMFFGAFVGSKGAGQPRPILNFVIHTQAEITQAGQPGAVFHVNKSGSPGSKAFNLDIRGSSLSSVKYTLTSGTMNVGDTVSATVGAGPTTWSGTIKALFTSGGFTYASIENLPTGQGVLTFNSTCTTSGGASFTIANANNDVIYYIGMSSFGSGPYGFGAVGCNFTYFTSHGFLADSNGSLVNGDYHILHCKISYCAMKVTNGAGADGEYGARAKIWFNEFYNNGTADSVKNHNGYNSGGVCASYIGNKSWFDGNYGNCGFVFHGKHNANADATAMTQYWGGTELAYTIVRGTRTGIDINDGAYGTPEGMYGFNVHHNLVDSIGGNGNGTSSLSWYISNLRDSRIYSNITTNSTTGSIMDDSSPNAGDAQTGNLYVVGNTWHNSTLLIGSGADGTKATNITNLVSVNNIFNASAATALIIKGYSMPDAQLIANNNLYHTGSVYGSAIQWDLGSSPTNMATAAALHAAFPSFETAGLDGDPLFVNTATLDFNLGALSPARANGQEGRYMCGMAADYALATINTATPHIGALQTA